MKTKNIIIYLTSMLLLLTFNSCDLFDDLNTNPNKPTPDMYDFNESKLGTILRYGIDMNFADDNGNLNGGGHLHQRLKDLNIDYFSQYMHSADNGGPCNYTPNDAWNFEYWKGHYQWLGSLNEIIAEGEGDARRNNTQIARIWRVYIQSQATDYFGPIPFPMLLEDLNPDYMSLQEQYNIFFSELDEAVNLMDPNLPIIGINDPVYFGSFDKWQQFGNSLRLRLALKVSEVNESLAKTQAQAAVNAPGGLMQKDGKAAVAGQAGWGNQYNYYMYQVAWGSKHLMTTSFEKILTDIGGLPYDGSAATAPVNVDPRGARYFDPSVNSNTWKGVYPGLPDGERSGINVDNAYLSQIYIIPNDTRKTEAFLYEEVCFLLAEAYERGFIPGGTAKAKEAYEEGVKASLANWGVGGTADNYLASTSKNKWGTSASYDDTVGTGNTKLEKIITQKYIANFPDIANQAWNDKRRLNLPAFDVPKYRDESAGYSASNMNIKDPKNFIKRMVFPQNEAQINKSKYDVGVQLLGTGGDKVSTNLWWDVNANYCTSE